MNILVKFEEQAKEDFEQLPEELKQECSKHIKELMKRGYRYGKPLGNKYGMDLTGYYKVFFDQAKYRIIYTYNCNNEAEIIKIV